jgi:hydroxymethylpyrimidine/phosphomethylpyrimidine kinase
MLGSGENVAAIAAFLRREPRQLISVFDPVLCSSSGHELVEPGALRRIQTELLPTVGWATPNWHELGMLAGMTVRTIAEAREACHAIGRIHPELHIVATGGDQDEPVDLLRLPDGRIEEFRGEHVETTSTHGTGCAFSSALLCRLILGDAPVEAVAQTKAYVTEALRRAPGLGHGRGPLDLLWPLRAVTRAGC